MKNYSSFARLGELVNKWQSVNMRQLLDDEERQNMNLEASGLWVDYSKSLVDREVLEVLFNLAREADLEGWRDKMYQGEKINFTENRAVLHTALRYKGNEDLWVDGQDVRSLVNVELNKMKQFVGQLRDGGWRGGDGQEIRDIINIGIGGSDLGPKMVCKALKPYHMQGKNFHFVSNVDGSHLWETVKNLNPNTCLFIIASKTFTTKETMMNAYTARNWFLNNTNNQGDVGKHFVAVSTNREAVRSFGIDEKNMFGFWDWVGGRYSVWSAIGLSVMIAIGEENFDEFLHGAYEMDKHFKNTSIENNLPVILALIGIWYRNFMKYPTYGVLPYDQNLEFLPAYLQQLDMESNGKSINRSGERIDYETGPVIWGEAGTNGQHAFYQLLHQGVGKVPVDIIMAVNNHHAYMDHQKVLVANALAQTEAWARGKNYEEVVRELMDKSLPEEEIRNLAPHKVFEGNRPSITILMKKLNPRTLGALLAMYEHKVFVQGIIWGINSFDQMGVELGKVLAQKYEILLDQGSEESSLMCKIKAWKN